MKIIFNNEELLDLSPLQIKILSHEIDSKTLNADIKRRIKWVITHKIEQIIKRLKTEWVDKLKQNGISSIPLNDEEFAQLVFTQPNYKSMPELRKELTEQGR